MNRTGCPADLATDGAFQAATVGACDTNIIGFYVYTLLFVAGLKFVSALKQFSNWMSRPTHKRKIPRGPLNSLMFCTVLIILAVLVGENIVNYKNGFSFSLFSVGFMNFVWSYSVGLKRLVSLGEKIIPKSSRGTSASSQLANFDGLGKVLFTIQTISAVVSSVVLIVLSPIFTQNELVVSRIGFGSKGVFMAFCIGGYVYQFQRCIKTIRNVQDNAMVLKSDPAMKRDMDKVILKMRGNQMVHVLFGGPPALTFILLAAGAVPANVWVVFLVPLMESLGSVMMEFAVRAPDASKSGGGSGESKKTSKGALAGEGAVGTGAAGDGRYLHQQQLQVVVEPDGVGDDNDSVVVKTEVISSKV